MVEVVKKTILPIISLNKKKDKLMSLDYIIYYAIAGIMTMIGAAVSGRLKSKFAKYSKVPLSKGQSGKDIAAEMLDYYGISDVKIVRGQGVLTDHYNLFNLTFQIGTYGKSSFYRTRIRIDDCANDGWINSSIITCCNCCFRCN